jgi:putative restriction endonuclease
VTPYVALTDKAWFDFVSSRAVDGGLDEANFWSPNAQKPMKRFELGEPIFLRLKKPHHAIAGYGFFAHWSLLDLDAAWDFFAWKNGDPDKVSFFERLGRYRGIDLFDASVQPKPLACTLLRSVSVWPQDRWIAWGDAMGWPSSTQQGKTETDEQRVELLLGLIATEQHDTPEEFTDAFALVGTDERRVVEARIAQREGQGTFRARLLDAYGRRCAITGEHTEPVLDAAHIQPDLGPRSNHLQNGLVLTKEFHVLFDRGLVTVTPDYEVRVSSRIKAEWKNGRYYPYDGKQLAQLPAVASQRPSQEALAWHLERVFQA